MCDFLVLAERPLLFAVCQSNSSGKIRRIDSDAHAVRKLEGQEKGNVLSRGFRRERKSTNLLRKAGPAGPVYLNVGTSCYLVFGRNMSPSQLRHPTVGKFTIGLCEARREPSFRFQAHVPFHILPTVHRDIAQRRSAGRARSRWLRR